MKTRLFILAALTLALAACNNDNEILNMDGPVAVRFTADIAPATRASGTTWDNGDRIGITDIGTQYDNVPFSLKDGMFEAEGNAIYIADGEAHTFRAYYPYDAAGGILTATTDAAAQQNQPAIDFLFATGATGSFGSPVVSFTDKTAEGGEDHSFHHCMSQITLTFKEGAGVNFSQAKPDGYKLGGLKLTGTFNTADGTAAADNEAQAGALAMELTDGNLTSSVILFPQTAASLPLNVMFNNNEYNATLTVPEGALRAGKRYIYTVKVNSTGLAPEGCTIGDWEPGNDDKGTADYLDYIEESDGSYTVYSAKGLLAWAEATKSDPALNCTLADDIDLTGIDWTPVGTDNNNPYTGTFDGGGHTITGLTVTTSDEYAGLFGCIGSGGTVMNVTLTDIQIEIESNNRSVYAGGVVGQNAGTVTGCHTTGSVSGTSSSSSSAYVGGVAGYNKGGTLENCFTTGSVSGTGGNNHYGFVYAGGVVGWNDGTVTGCYATGDVSGTGNSVYVGGVVGRNYAGTVTDCHTTGSVSGTGSSNGSVYAGGVVGLNYGTVTGCHTTGSVSGTGSSSLSYVYVGGVAGYNPGTVTGCYATGDVSGTGRIVYVGGVVGLTNSGTVTGSYATGSVSGTGDSSTSYVYVGGVVGRNIGTVTGCYATGSVSGTVGEYVYVGGVVGRNYNGTVTGCYWSNYDGNGIGNDSGSGETTKVDGTDVTWLTAQGGMNIAIDAWNNSHPDNPCNWHYEGATATTPPTLVASSNP